MREIVLTTTRCYPQLTAQWLVLLLCTTMTFNGADNGADNGVDVPRYSEAEALLSTARASLLQGDITQQELKQLTALVAPGQPATVRSAAIGVFAAQRLLSGTRGAEALEVLAPCLGIDATGVAAWKKQALSATQAGAIAQREAAKAARAAGFSPPIPKPVESSASFPTAATWQVQSTAIVTVPVAIEALLVDHQVGSARKALNGFQDRFATHGINGIYALRASSMVEHEEGNLEAEIELLGQALALLDELVTEDRGSAGEHQREASLEEHLLREDLLRRRDAAQEARDLARYGEAWVIYRTAERWRRTDKRPLDAILAYDELKIRFPESVFSEAAQCYRIVTLFTLSTPAGKRMAEDAIRQTEKLQGAGRLSVSPMKLRLLRQIPLGTAAAKQAEVDAEAFIAAQPWGLYRGEMLVLLAKRRLQIDLDPVAAQTAFQRAWQWLTLVDSAQIDLAAYQVPREASGIAAPPQITEERDTFGNLRPVVPAVGTIVNRLTCAWYLDDLRQQAALPLAFLALWDKDLIQAQAWCTRLVTLEGHTGRAERTKEWDDVKRISWGAQHGYLHAFPQELELYQGRQRFLVLLADFLFCTQHFAEAGMLATRLVGGDFGELSSAQKDYPLFLIATCTYWLTGHQDALDGYLAVLTTRDGTFTEDRAAFAYGNLASASGDLVVAARGQELLRQLANSSQPNHYVYRAKLLYGIRRLQTGWRADGVAMLSSIPEAAGGYKQLADSYLAQMGVIQPPTDMLQFDLHPAGQ